jgi:fido (protein-threonine AMPylation protein)
MGKFRLESDEDYFGTLREIEDVVGTINVHPEYSALLKNRLMQNLQNEAEKHSVGMEVNGERNLNSSELQTEREKALKNLGEAKTYLSKRGFYLRTFSPLGHIIEPGSDSKPTPNDFRKKSIVFGSFEGVPFRNIYQGIENLLYVVKEDVSLHPVKRAIQAHIELVRIHPYMDGNGRAARLFQNLVLERHGFPCPVIKVDEGKTYRGLMNLALEQRIQKGSNIWEPTAKERLFHDYIEGKILDSSRIIQEELSSKRIYDVEVSGASPNLLQKIASILRKANSKGKPVKVNIRKDRKKSHLVVQGDLGKRTVRIVLDRVKSKEFFNYSF